MVILAISWDDCQEQPGDILWAKLTMHTNWPTTIEKGSHLGKHKSLKSFSSEISAHVQCSGAHDLARKFSIAGSRDPVQLLTECNSCQLAFCYEPFTGGLVIRISFDHTDRQNVNATAASWHT
uniref:Uncharacterized protein n=1 Tax=Nelumbo nucifera TaxID=4432 RepID=A0A822XXI5_NELNU|nr:TPA_asm: hypothetical protein HUJ06_025364 [Nelumbo nucifera]